VEPAAKRRSQLPRAPQEEEGSTGPEGAIQEEEEGGGVSVTGFQGIPIHLLLGHFKGPFSSTRSRKKISAKQTRPP
jgi:hypothetical protein